MRKRSFLLLSAALSLLSPTLLFPTLAAAQGTGRSVELQPGLTATVLDLKKVPGQQIVQLDYEVKNSGTEPVNLAEVGIGRAAYGLNEITLYDFPKEISFRIGVASECLCSQPPEEPLAPGATFTGWAWYAPPLDTNPGPFAVRFGSTLPILDVPVE